MKGILSNISKKKTKTAIGLISGTSIDGIDTVLLQISGSEKSTKIKIIDFITFPINGKIKSAILKNSDNHSARIEEICRLNVILGEIFAEAVSKILKKNKLTSEQVDFIGSHGQTIHHLSDAKNYLGHTVKSTMQIGDPSVIANITGITTIGDFRIADCALSGDGAPLVPYLDYILFSSKKISRALLNIGGISNITVLPKNCSKDEVIAFDTGPGNMLIDGLMKKLYDKEFDKDGLIAGKGRVNEKLFNWLKNDRYYRLKPPKSTGREHYGKDFQKRMLLTARNIPKTDIIKTVTEFTAFSIWYNYNKFIKLKTRIKELIISGGGYRNRVLLKSLSSYFKGISIKGINSHGINSDNKEAVLFAVLANECLSGNPANMKSVTGAKGDAVLGKICLGQLRLSFPRRRES